MMDERRLADELLRGVPAIAEYTGDSPRQIYELLEAGRLPGFKTPGGRVWHAFKSTIDEHYRRLDEKVAAKVEAA
jgi:hypothetical protein